MVIVMMRLLPAANQASHSYNPIPVKSRSSGTHRSETCHLKESMTSVPLVFFTT